MIKFELPDDDKFLMECVGAALICYANGNPVNCKVSGTTQKEDESDDLSETPPKSTPYEGQSFPDQGDTFPTGRQLVKIGNLGFNANQQLVFNHDNTIIVIANSPQELQAAFDKFDIMITSNSSNVFKHNGQLVTIPNFDNQLKAAHILASTGVGTLSETEIKNAFQNDTVQKDVADTQPAGSIFDQEAANNVERDPKGVAKHPDYCATAKQKFYLKGNKYFNQWKRKQGCSEADYVKWYEAELLLVPQDKMPGPNSTKTVDTQAAFAANGPTNQANQAPTDTGALFAWFAEQQALGTLQTTDLDLAWSANSLTMNDLMDPIPAAQIGINVSRLYVFLSALASKKS